MASSRWLTTLAQRTPPDPPRHQGQRGSECCDLGDLGDRCASLMLRLPLSGLTGWEYESYSRS